MLPQIGSFSIVRKGCNLSLSLLVTHSLAAAATEHGTPAKVASNINRRMAQKWLAMSKGLGFMVHNARAVHISILNMSINVAAPRHIQT
jgi:hypothetical protein